MRPRYASFLAVNNDIAISVLPIQMVCGLRNTDCGGNLAAASSRSSCRVQLGRDIERSLFYVERYITVYVSLYLLRHTSTAFIEQQMITKPIYLHNPVRELREIGDIL